MGNQYSHLSSEERACIMLRLSNQRGQGQIKARSGLESIIKCNTFYRFLDGSYCIWGISTVT